MRKLAFASLTISAALSLPTASGKAALAARTNSSAPIVISRVAVKLQGKEIFP